MFIRFGWPFLAALDSDFEFFPLRVLEVFFFFPPSPPFSLPLSVATTADQKVQNFLPYLFFNHPFLFFVG